MIAAIRNWLLLVLFMVGAVNLWDSVSGELYDWSRQCYFHANSIMCNYGPVDTAVVLAVVTVFIVCLWLFVLRTKVFAWWTLLIGTLVFGFLAILGEWYVFTQMDNTGANGTTMTNWFVNFLNGRNEIAAAVLGASVVIVLQLAFKPGDAK